MGETRCLFENPLHPYTRALLKSATGEEGLGAETQEGQLVEVEPGHLVAKE